jgi:hypothetical protein
LFPRNLYAAFVFARHQLHFQLTCGLTALAFSRMTELGGRYQLAVLSTSVDGIGEATGAVSASAAGGRDSGDSGTFVAVGEEILGFAA